MKPLLVPTNFSSGSVNAANYAADMALALNTDLYLLHVLQLPVSASEVPLTEDVYEDMQQQGEEGLNSLKADLEKRTGGKINISTILETGSVEHHLEEFCNRRNPFAVIMGIGKNGAERFMFGSNALFAIQHLRYPLLVIPDEVSFHAIKKIVLACDLTDSNESLPIGYLKELQLVFHASFDVLNINTKKINDIKSNHEFASLKDMLRDLYPTYYFNIANSVEEGINKFLDENDADLLLLIPKRHGIFEFHRSHTKKMALKSPVPVMSIHG